MTEPYTADRIYPWMPLDSIEEWRPLAKRRGVSKVARSPRGFLRAYQKAGGDPNRISLHWRRRRQHFIARHMAQAAQNGEALWDIETDTPSNRGLALMMWAFRPPVYA